MLGHDRVPRVVSRYLLGFPRIVTALCWRILNLCSGTVDGTNEQRFEYFVEDIGASSRWRHFRPVWYVV